MTRARFEEIDEIQNDAIKLMLKREEDETGRIPATASGSPLSQSAPWNWLDLYRPID